MLGVALEEDARAELVPGLDEICREGAQGMLAAALELEVDCLQVKPGLDPWAWQEDLNL